MKRLVIFFLFFVLQSGLLLAQERFYYELYTDGEVSDPILLPRIWNKDLLSSYDRTYNEVLQRIHYFDFRSTSQELRKVSIEYFPRNPERDPVGLFQVERSLEERFGYKEETIKNACRIFSWKEYLNCLNDYAKKLAPVLRNLDPNEVTNFTKKFIKASKNVGLLNRAEDDLEIIHVGGITNSGMVLALDRADNLGIVVDPSASFSWTMDADSWNALLCHELGHIKGLAPYDFHKGSGRKISWEGQADHYAARTCLPKMLDPKLLSTPEGEDEEYFYSRCKLVHKSEVQADRCFRIGKVGQKMAISGRSLGAYLQKERVSFKYVLESYDKKSLTSSHPDPSCTVAIYASTALCEEDCPKHACWFDKN